MPTIRDVAMRALGLVRRGSMERRLDAEMRFHVDMLTEQHIRAGRSPSDARRAALAAFGGLERFKDDARDEYRSRLVDELGQDIRYAIRVIRRNPGFGVAAALTFALGIGASTAIFSVVHGVLLRPLPYKDPDRLVVLWERQPGRGNDRNVVSVPNFEAWRSRARSFDGMAALVPLPATIGVAPNPEHVMGAEVSPGYFETLGVSPALGRTFASNEEQNGGADVIVLSDGFWRSHFAADPRVVGRSLSLDGRPQTIVGVMPASFDPPRFAWLNDQAFWRPFAPTENNRGWGRFLLVVGRVRADVPVSAALREVQGIAAQRATEDRGNEGWSANMVGLAAQITGDARLPLLVLLGAVCLLLLMAVTNVANLTLGLVRRREHELAVRRAIGATWGRLLRQIVTLSAVVGASGCLIGSIAAVGGVHALLALLPPETPRSDSIRVDAPVLLFTASISAIAALVVGAVAALRGGGSGAASLRETGGRAAARLRGGSLVTAEVALGLVLTVLAGLTMRTFEKLRSVDLGFDADHVVVARVGVSGARYRTPEARAVFFDQVLSRVRALPGVQAASAVSTRPFGGMAPATTLGDASAPVTGDSVEADVRYADADLFRTLHVPLVAGSSFDARDALDAPPRVVINRTLARRLWPSENPIGKRLRVPMFNGIAPEVIGVVGDVHLMDARTPARGAIYLANARFPMDALDLVVRTNADGAAMAKSLQAIVTALDPSLPVYSVTMLDDMVGRALSRDRFTAALLGAFALVSLLLAAVGIYGVFAGDVAQRRKEIGIRVALGAPSGGVVALVMRRAVTRAVLGVALGTGAALLAARAMRSLLFGVGAADPVSFVGVATLLLLVAVAATLVPAVRAARVSPLVAIRTD
ncbi:MAG TPA: ABC transporter permease [Gemmatimonadaceae bacterium]|nr:ABC transporter permease [Gemmatimonadaceae bacterium]